MNENMNQHDATRRPKSRYAAGPVSIPAHATDDDGQMALWPELPVTMPNDPVNHPAHYTQHPSGIEAIQVTEHMGFCLGNAVKYIWRADLKADAIEDLKKAVWYINREIEKRTK